MSILSFILNCLGWLIIKIISVPVYIASWIYGLFCIAKQCFQTVEKQEEYYEKEYLCFAENPREYPHKHLQSLKDCCLHWKEYWSSPIIPAEGDDVEEIKELKEFQAEKIAFWDNAAKKVSAEIWQSSFREA